MTLLEDLRWRGLVADCTDETELATRLAADKKITLYCGFDPTSDSLHVGNLVPLLALGRFQKHGHHPIALAGGATGMIGDPSGKSAERNLLTPEQIAHNVHCIKGQLHRLLDFKTKINPAHLVDNATWTAPITYLEFLRDAGKFFTVNWMVAKESVRARMEDRENGISYTEFSYMLLQAYDFYHLHQARGCELQIGATDQWGNITAGIELIRKKAGAHAFGLTAPLMTKADGTKYGKTADGAIWLDPKKTSPYRFYQFFVRLEDADVIKITKMLSFADHDTIGGLARQHEENPAGRAAHLALARELTTLVHGESACADAIAVSEALFKRQVTSLDATKLQFAASGAPQKLIDFQNPSTSGGFIPIDKPLIDSVVFTDLYPSKGQARQAILGGGIYLNEKRVTDPNQKITPADFLHGQHMVIRSGQSNYVFVSGIAPIVQDHGQH